MKAFLSVVALMICSSFGFAQNPKSDSLHYLALGDSYTVGRYVDRSQSFPYQLAAKLNSKHIATAQPVLIAQNGWRTDELINGIKQQTDNARYDLVTLLIGVNNQYQKKDIETYRKEFAEILNSAIFLAKGNQKHVFVLSIPDWGVTPFANGRNRENIAAEIDAYNAINKKVTKAAGANYINITELSRAASDDKEYVTTDNLHPSAKMYKWWVDRLYSRVAASLK